MSTLIIDYEDGGDGHGRSTAVNLLLDDELAAALTRTDRHALAGAPQTLELVELVRFCGQPGDLIAIEVPSDGVPRLARRLDAMVGSGQLR